MKRRSARTRRRHAYTNRRLSDKYYYVGDYDQDTQIRLTQYNKEKVQTVDIKADEPSFARFASPSMINWFQITGLTNADAVTRIVKDFGFDRLDAKDILTPHHIVKVEKYAPDRLFVIMNYTNYNDNKELLSEHFCILLSGNVIMTFGETNLHFFDNVQSALESNLMDLRNRKSTLLLAFLLNTILVSMVDCATKIEDQLEEIEDQLLDITGNQTNLGSVIQQQRRDYIQIRKNCMPLKDQFVKLIYDDPDDKELRSIFTDLNDQLLYVCQTIEGCREMITSLVDLYISNNDLRMNAIMKRLTVVSTIFIPLTFLVGVWGMNFEVMPELKLPYGYLLAWLLMIIIAFIMWLLLKRKNWF